MTTPDGQIILEEDIDENYEPTEQEVLEYASWLGMDVDKEKDLLWVAREGLKAPLPDNWKPCKTPTGDIYYFDFGSGESIWDHPCDEFYRKLYQDEKKKRGMGKSGLGTIKTKGPSPLGNGQQKQKGMRVTAANSTSHSLQNSFDALPEMGKANPKPLALGALKPLGSSMDAGNLGPLKGSGLAPLSGSGSDWKSPPGANNETNRGPVRSSRTKRQTDDSLSLSMDDDDKDTKEVFRVRLDKELVAWERRAQADFEQEGEEIERQFRRRLAQLRDEFDAQETSHKRKMSISTDEIVAEYKKQMEAREAREKEELLMEMKRAVGEAEDEHRKELNTLRAEHEEVEAALADKITASRQALDEADILEDSEIEETRQAARERALDELEREVQLEVEGMREEMMEKAKAKVDKEISSVQSSMKDEAMQGARLAADSANQRNLDGIESEISSKKKVLEDLESLAVEKKTAIDDVARDLRRQENKVADLEDDVAKKKRELADLEDDVAKKKHDLSDVDARLADRRSELDELVARLQSKREEDSELDKSIAQKKSKSGIMHKIVDDHLRLSVSDMLFSYDEDSPRGEDEGVKAGAREVDQAGKGSGVNETAVSEMEARLKEAKMELEDAKIKLVSVESQVSMKKGELAAVAEEVGRQRAQALSKEAQTMECQLLEADLSRLQSELARVQAELASAKLELGQTQLMLRNVSDEVADKQRRSIQLGAEVAGETAALSQLESRLGEGRTQLDRLSATLDATRREVEEAKANKVNTLHEQENIEAQRFRLAREVSETIHSERQATMDSQRARLAQEVQEAVRNERQTLMEQRMAAMAADVDRVVSEQRVKREAAASAAHQYHQTAATATARGPPSDVDDAFSTGGMPMPMSALSPKVPFSKLEIPNTKLDKFNPLALGAGSESDATSHLDARHSHHHHPVQPLTPVFETPRDSVLTLDDIRRGDRTAELTRSTDRLQKSLEMLLKQPGGVLGQVGGLMHSGGNGVGYSRYNSADRRDRLVPGGSSPGPGHSEDEDAYSLAARGSTWGPRAKELSYSTPDRLAPDSPTSFPDYDLIQNPGMLSKAKSYLRHQKRSLKDRQSMIQRARDDWKMSMGAAESCPDGSVRAHQAKMLKQVKDVLEEQAHRLNSDASQLRNLKSQIKAVESRGLAASHTRQPSASRTRDKHPNHQLSYQSDHHVHRQSTGLQHARQQQSQVDQQAASAAAAALAAVIPLIQASQSQFGQSPRGGAGGDYSRGFSPRSAGGPVSQQYSQYSQADSGTPKGNSLRDSLEKLSLALNEAINAASSPREASQAGGQAGGLAGGDEPLHRTVPRFPSRGRGMSSPKPAWMPVDEEAFPSNPRSHLRRASFSSSTEFQAQSPPSFTFLNSNNMGASSVPPPSSSLARMAAGGGYGFTSGGTAWRGTGGPPAYAPSSSAHATGGRGGAAPMRLDIGGGQEIVISVGPK